MPSGQDRIPNAVEFVGSAGATWTTPDGWEASLRARYIGEAPLVDVRAAGGVRAWLDSDPGPALGIVNVDAFRKPADLAGLGCFVLDESSCLKNMAGVVRNVLVRAVAPVPYRFAFSATPELL